MSPRRRALALSAFILLFGLTMVPKLLLGGARGTDDARLAGDVAARLRASGFTVKIHPDDHAVRAVRDRCRLFVRNGDGGAALAVALARDAADIGPIRFGYRDHWTTEPPGMRAQLERWWQGQAAVIARAAPRPAVLAVARSPSCPDIVPIIGGLRVWTRSDAAPTDD